MIATHGEIERPDPLPQSTSPVGLPRTVRGPRQSVFPESIAHLCVCCSTRSPTRQSPSRSFWPGVGPGSFTCLYPLTPQLAGVRGPLARFWLWLLARVSDPTNSAAFGTSRGLEGIPGPGVLGAGEVHVPIASPCVPAPAGVLVHELARKRAFGNPATAAHSAICLLLAAAALL